MDLVNELITDHWQIREVLKDLRSEKATYQRKRRLLKELTELVAAHAKGEEKTANAFARKRLKKLATLDVEEHSTLENLVERLKKTRSQLIWEARMHVFCELLELHLDEEEEEYFPELRNLLPAEESDRLAHKYHQLTLALEKKRPKLKPGLLGWLSGNPPPETFLTNY